MAQINLSEEGRDQLSELKDEMGMTYDGVVKYLLKNEAERRANRSDNEELTTMPEPTQMYRRGAKGAEMYVMNILGSQVPEPNEYRSTAVSAVWDMYEDQGIETQPSERPEGSEPPTLDDLIEMVSRMLENPAKHSLSGSEIEVEMLSEDRARIGQALISYRQRMGKTEISLESKEPLNLAVPRDRTYRGAQHNGNNIVTADGDDLDIRPDLNHGTDSVSWGYRGTGPHALAVAILSDAYQSDQFSRIHSSDLFDNYTSKIPTGESWEIQAGELEQHLDI